MNQVLLSEPFYRWGNWGPEKISKVHVVLVMDRARVWTWVPWLCSPCPGVPVALWGRLARMKAYDFYLYLQPSSKSRVNTQENMSIWPTNKENNTCSSIIYSSAIYWTVLNIERQIWSNLCPWGFSCLVGERERKEFRSSVIGHQKPAQDGVGVVGEAQAPTG